MKNKFIEKASAKLTKLKFGMKKHSPEILIIVGGIGVVTSAVMACKATLKASDIIDNGKDHIDAIKETYQQSTSSESTISYDDRDYKRDLTRAYAVTTGKVVVAYLPSVVLGGLSMTAMVGSNMILRKRNAGLAAAYMTIDKSFKEYRDRVTERFGERVDYELLNGVKAIETKEKVKDEDGKTKTVKNVIDVVEKKEPSEYAFYFDKTSRYYEKNMEYDLMFANHCENVANDIYNADGHLFLNDIRQLFGLPRTEAGQVVGWVKTGPDDNSRIVLGIQEMNLLHSVDFSDGYDKEILISPNVQGYILGKTTMEKGGNANAE